MRKSIYCIGQRIKECRKEKSWTQKDLAQRIGTSYKYLSHVENGVKFPSLEMLVCIARELDVSLDYLIGSDKIPNRIELTDEITRLLSDCSSEEYTFILEVITFLQAGMKKHGDQITL